MLWIPYLEVTIIPVGRHWTHSDFLWSSYLNSGVRTHCSKSMRTLYYWEYSHWAVRVEISCSGLRAHQCVITQLGITQPLPQWQWYSSFSFAYTDTMTFFFFTYHIELGIFMFLKINHFGLFILHALHWFFHHLLFSFEFYFY